MKRYYQNKYYLLAGVIVLYSLSIIPLIVYNARQHQSANTHAQVAASPTPMPPACSIASPVNVMIALDRAGTMGQSDKFNINHLTAAEVAAMDFVSSISADMRNTVGLVSYASTASLDSPLTNNYASIQNHISSLTASGQTCVSCALKLANQEIARDSVKQYKSAIILLIDGTANASENSPYYAEQSAAEQEAGQEASQSAAQNTAIYPVSIGTAVDAQFLVQLALQTHGQYYFSPSTKQVKALLNIIETEITKGQSCIPISDN
jgi:Mg-chelatase subunit ChlD